MRVSPAGCLSALALEYGDGVAQNGELSHIQKPSPSKWGLLFLISFLVSSASLTLLMFLSLYCFPGAFDIAKKRLSLYVIFYVSLVWSCVHQIGACS
jgi:hypothetical protein